MRKYGSLYYTTPKFKIKIIFHIKILISPPTKIKIDLNRRDSIRIIEFDFKIFDIYFITVEFSFKYKF